MAGDAREPKTWHTPEQRQIAVALVLREGVPEAGVARSFGVTTKTIKNWVKKFSRRGRAGLKTKRRPARKWTGTP